MKTTRKHQDVMDKSLKKYLALAFIPAWVLFLFPLVGEKILPGSGQRIALIAWGLAMWMPGAGALLAVSGTDHSPFKKLNLHRLGGKKYYFWAWLIPLILVVITGVLTWVFKLGVFDRELPLIQEMIQQLPEGSGISPRTLLVVQLAASLTLAPLFNTLFALGEELGWRGYLLPKLLPLGEKKALVISGVVWGVWHAPVILQGHNYPQSPRLGAGMMVIFTLLLGIFLGWLYLKTKSPWAPALAHGTINAVASLPLLFLGQVNITWGGTLASAVGWIPLLALALFLYGIGEMPAGKKEERFT